MKKYIFWFSIILNILFILGYLFNKINSPSNKLGLLKEDIEIGYFSGTEKIFVLPKGLTVQDKSERGLAAIGQFENERFSIVITANRDLVNYKINKDSLNLFGNFYSAEIKEE